jgi:hypothetical protein
MHRPVRDGQASGMSEQRADVQGLSDVDLIVYEAVATLGQDGSAAEADRLREMTDLPEEDVWQALNHLVQANHVHATDHGYTLGPHDWSVWQ